MIKCQKVKLKKKKEKKKKEKLHFKPIVQGYNKLTIQFQK